MMLHMAWSNNLASHDVDVLHREAQKPLFLVDAGRGELVVHDWHPDNATLASIRTFNVRRKTKQVLPSRAVFADDGAKIISGSDHGVVYVLDSESGRVVYWLKTGLRTPVSKIAVCCCLLCSSKS